MRRKDVGVIMKSCVAALSTAVVLTAMPTQVNAAPTKSVTVSTQKSLNAALKNSKVGTITIKTSKDMKISIPKGKFTSKSVVMNASKASLTNNGTLKTMTIKSAKIVTEKADNNKINITDKGLRLIVAKGADNSKVSIGTKDAKVTVVADGKVASVTVNKKALVAVTGTTNKPVQVTSKVDGTGLILASKANVSLKNSTNVDVRKGADLGTVTAYDNASLKVAKGAKIATFNSTGDKASVKLVTNGAVGNVVLKKKATVTITGEPTKKVAVTNNASGSLVKLSVNADVKATQPTTVNAYKGSEIGKVTATKDLVLNVSSGAKVDTVKSQGEDAKVTVNTNGTVGDVIIDKKAEVTVKGTTTTPVNVTSNAADSVLSVSAVSKITLNESAKVNVAEGAKVESLTAVKDVAVTVDAKAEVAEVVVKGEDAKVDVTANGTVGAVTVDAKAEVSIKGETDSSVVVNANVESAKINTEVKTEVKANANIDITFGEGAEGSNVVAGEDVNTTVTNNTKEDVKVTDSTGKDTTVDAGKTEETKPAPTPDPYYPPVITTPTPTPTPTPTSKTKLSVGLLYSANSKNIQMLFWDESNKKWLSKTEIEELGLTGDKINEQIQVKDGAIELEVCKNNEENETWTVYNYNVEGEESTNSNNRYIIPETGFEAFKADNYDDNGNFKKMYGEDAGYLKVHLKGKNTTNWNGFTCTVDGSNNDVTVSVNFNLPKYEFELQPNEKNPAKDTLTAEVIFGAGSKNIQILFKQGDTYLSQDDILKLNLSEIVNALSINDDSTQLALKGPSQVDATWTIHQVGSANGTTTHTCGEWTQNGENLNVNCKQNIPEVGYGVYPASAWDGLSTGGVLTTAAPNAGFLKIHLGADSWNGFSEDFNAKSNVTINFSSTNYEITVKNFGGAERPTQNGER